MTKSELIAHLAGANPHLRQPDVELIVSTIFEEISVPAHVPSDAPFSACMLTTTLDAWVVFLASEDERATSGDAHAAIAARALPSPRSSM